MYRTPEATWSAGVPTHMAWISGWAIAEARRPMLWPRERSRGAGAPGGPGGAHRYRGGGAITRITVGEPPGRHEQHVALGGLGTRRGDKIETDRFAGRRPPPDRRAQPQIKTLPVQLGEPRPDMGVVPGQQVPAARDDSDPAAERAEDVSHLGCDVPAAQHDHLLFHPVQLQHRIRLH